MEAGIFSGGIGTNNKTVPHRLPYDLETGIAAFEETKDIVVDNTGVPVTRKGMDLLVPGSHHSSFPVPGGFYCVLDRPTTHNDSALYLALVNENNGQLDMQGVRSGLSMGRKMSYTIYDGRVLYSNGRQNGQLDSGVSSHWPYREYPGPTPATTIDPVPPANHIDQLAGRILFSIDDELFATKYGLPGLYDSNGDRRRFEGRIIMVLAVETGAYISTDKAVYYQAGLIPKEWKLTKVLDYPAVEWGRHPGLVEPKNYGIDGMSLSGLFATVNGPVVGLQDGRPINLIEDAVELPAGCQSGAIMTVDDSMIIQS